MSVEKWARKSAKKTRSILNWFVPKLDGGLERIHKMQQDKFMHDAYNKMEQQKQKAVTCNLTQSSLSAYLTLTKAYINIETLLCSLLRECRTFVCKYIAGIPW